MATNPISGFSLPADLPENWLAGQIVSPNGAEVSLSEQHGYNYLMQAVNTAQRALAAIGAAFPGLLDNTTPLTHYGVCSSAANTVSKTVTVTGDLSTLTAGVSVRVLFVNGNVANSPTLNVNNLGAKSILAQNGAVTSMSGYWSSGEVIDLVFTGSAWQIVDAGELKLARGVDGILDVANGGTGLSASPYMLVNLATTSAVNVFQSSPRPGVTGTLPILRGGTGQTTAANALYALINGAVALTASTLTATDYIGIGDASASTGKKLTVEDLLKYITQTINPAYIQVGGYIGTGTFGEANPTSITFTKAPQLVRIYRYSYDRIQLGGRALSTCDFSISPMINGSYYEAASSSNRIDIEWTNSGKTASWYSNNSAASQFNANNYSYYWVAISREV